MVVSESGRLRHVNPSYGSNGTTQTGFGGVFDNPSSGFGGDNCVGSLNFLAL
jgi:hypothetical protein